MSETVVKTRISEKYKYLKPEDIDTCYDLALSDYLLIKYPSDNNRPTVDKIKFDFVTTQWLFKRMVDILERAGGTSVVSYKENGVSFTYGASFIDPALVCEIMPRVGVPR